MPYRPMAFLKKSKRDESDIESELRELRKFKQSVESRGAASSKAKVFLAKLWAGPALAKSIEAWMHAKQSNDPGQTITATANLIAAVFRRFMRVGFILILLAVIPMALIVWQNIIMERQNQSLINQIKAERAASSNQQVTEYLRLLLSSDDKEAKAAEGFLVSDVLNRDLAVERLAALLKAGNTDVQCSALRVLARIVASSPELTLQSAVSPQDDARTYVSDIRCEGETGATNIDFTGVDFGPITFSGIGFPQSNFAAADLSDVEFQESNLRHSDLSETFLCANKARCVRFVETDLSHSNLIFSNQSKDVFKSGVILKGAQMRFDRDFLDEDKRETGDADAAQIKSSRLIIPEISQNSLIASGVCYESSYSQCFLYHKAKDLEQLDAQRLSTLRQNNCPVNLDGPIVLTSISSCEKLGLQRRW